MIQVLEKTPNSANLYYITLTIQRTTLAVVVENFTPSVSQNITLAFYNLINLNYKLSTFSVSKKQLILEIRGKGKITCDLKRHLSPRTVGTIMRSLPMEGHAHLLGKSILYFETNVDSGTERGRSEFKKGDVAFLPSSGSICFFTHDAVFTKKMTPIGKLGENIDVLNDVKSGDVLCIYEETD